MSDAPSPGAQVKVSASRLKTLQECSLRYWYADVLRVPQAQHHKTVQGSVAHRLFDLLMRPKRRAVLERLVREGFDLGAHPWLRRYLIMYDHYHSLSPYNLAEMGEMLGVAFLALRPHFLSPDTGAFSPPPQFHNERYFKLDLGDGAVISGIVDLLLVWPGHRAVVIDLKSQGTKFTKAALPSNVQAAIYQLSVHAQFGLVPEVQFVMLRHPPGPRSPLKHIQSVPPHSEAALRGLSVYLKDMHQSLNSFSLEDALTSPSRDDFFCQRVCPYLKPFSYWAIVPQADPRVLTPIRTGLDTEVQGQYHLGTGERVVRREHAGCLAKWPQ